MVAVHGEGGWYVWWRQRRRQRRTQRWRCIHHGGIRASVNKCQNMLQLSPDDLHTLRYVNRAWHYGFETLAQNYKNLDRHKIVSFHHKYITKRLNFTLFGLNIILLGASNIKLLLAPITDLLAPGKPKCQALHTVCHSSWSSCEVHPKMYTFKLVLT